MGISPMSTCSARAPANTMRPLFPLAVLVLLILTTSARAETWNGFEREDFEVDGRACTLVRPRTAADGRPWIWRTEFFGREPQADIELLSRGFHLAYIN